jgi:hypothetical protein
LENNVASLSGKELAKLNKRKTFYNKFERLIKSMSDEQKMDNLIPLMLLKKLSFPEYDDVTLLFTKHTVIKDATDEMKEQAISLPFIDEGIFLKNMAEKELIEILREETLENSDGTARKGSTGSIDDYNYQSAFNFYVKILNEKDFSDHVAKEKEEPTTYVIKVKTKKMEKKKYIKTYRYPRRNRR